MRIFIIILVMAVLVSTGLFLFFKVRDFASIPPQSINPNVTLVGTVTETKPTIEYSYLLVAPDKSTPITSSKVDLSKFKDVKISATGQYSGTTLYIDEVKVLK